MSRLRYNGLTGTLGAAHNDSTTTLTLASKLTYVGGDVPTISGSDYLPLSILDADGNCAEIVHVTAYTSGATSATVTRGREGTAGAAHDNGATFVHGPTVRDVGASGASLTKSGTQSYTSGLVAITFDGESFDTDDYHNNSTNTERLTVPDDGLYLVGASVYLLDLDAGAWYFFNFRRNAVPEDPVTRVRNFAASNNHLPAYHTSQIFRAEAGDYFELVMECSQATTIRESSNGTTFWIARIA